MVILLSTAHDQPTISETTCEPHIIEDYNATKYGVDTLDQMCSNYSCSKKTRRWPLCMFYGMMNIACVNAWVIYTHNSQRQEGNQLSRKKILIQMSEELTKPWMAKRLETPSLQTNLRVTIVCVLGEGSSKEREPPTSSGKRIVCHICPSKKRQIAASVVAHTARNIELISVQIAVNEGKNYVKVMTMKELSCSYILSS